MVRTCKYIERNREEQKCSDYFFSGTKNQYFCRLSEWKKKKGICPYDKSIRTDTVNIKRKTPKEQTRLING